MHGGYRRKTVRKKVCGKEEGRPPDHLSRSGRRPKMCKSEVVPIKIFDAFVCRRKVAETNTHGLKTHAALISVLRSSNLASQLAGGKADYRYP
uniref:Uncharacterized protein n=1 Tax=Cannabis sativa TaxID=3483 RepID=A0A803PII5_CANSA